MRKSVCSFRVRGWALPAARPLALQPSPARVAMNSPTIRFASISSGFVEDNFSNGSAWMFPVSSSIAVCSGCGSIGLVLLGSGSNPYIPVGPLRLWSRPKMLLLRRSAMSGGWGGSVCGDSKVSVGSMWIPSGGSVAPASVKSLVSRRCATAYGPTRISNPYIFCAQRVAMAGIMPEPKRSSTQRRALSIAASG